MFIVYVLKSESTDKKYIGQTADMNRRLFQHNDSSNNFSEYTKKNKGPWKLVYKEEYESRQEAMKREKQLKGYRGRQFIRSKIAGR